MPNQFVPAAEFDRELKAIYERVKQRYAAYTAHELDLEVVRLADAGKWPDHWPQDVIDARRNLELS